MNEEEIKICTMKIVKEISEISFERISKLGLTDLGKNIMLSNVVSNFVGFCVIAGNYESLQEIHRNGYRMISMLTDWIDNYTENNFEAEKEKKH